MTPEEYGIFARSIEKQIGELEQRIVDAYDQVDGSLPADVRPATPADITVGRVIWHTDGDEGVFWNVVMEVRYPDDAFKAYVADDGSRYGLRNAFVRVDAAE